MRDYFELRGAQSQMRDRTTGAGRPIARLSVLASPKSKHDIDMVLFTSKIFCKIEIVALSFVFDKYCSIIN